MPEKEGENLIIAPSPKDMENLGLDPRQFGMLTSKAENLKNRFNEKFVSTESVQYEMPRYPLKITVADQKSELQIAEEDMELLLSCARWEIPPPYYYEGRNAFIRRKNDDPQDFIKAYKLKGIGACENNTAHPPNSKLFHSGIGDPKDPFGSFINRQTILIHMGIKEDGSFFPVIDPPKPLGGMRFSRAEAEFKNASILLRNNVASVMPVAYSKYEDLPWDNENMGFVILALPIKDHRRVSDLFEPERTESGSIKNISPYLREFLESNSNLRTSSNEGINIMKFIYDVECACGKTLRGFTNAGLCRFAGHTGNFSYNQKSNTAIIQDLDSCVAIESLSPKAKSMAIIRDINSALWGLTHSLIHSQIYNMCDYETLNNFNPFGAFLSGYFGKNEKFIRELSQKILAYFRALVATMPSFYNAPAFLEWFSTVEFQFDSDVMEMLMDVFPQSELGSTYPLPYDQEAFKGYMQQYQKDLKEIYEKECRKKMLELSSGQSPILDIKNISSMLRLLMTRGKFLA